MGRPGKLPVEGRYSATLLFQYRVTMNGQDDVVRTCEKRMLLLRAAGGRLALRTAKRRGREAEYDFTNSRGHPVHFEFVGVIDLLHLGDECESDEVWYDIVKMREPMERREKLVPSESELQAIRVERRRLRRR